MARLLDFIVGHQKNIEKLLSLKLQKRWPHAFLFTGPNAIGKRKVALAFAQMLVCEQSETACGDCGPCLRIAKEQSENLLRLAPDASMAKPVIKVEAVREVLDSLSLSSWSGARVVLIDEAHRMNPQAANTLLKTLEEPFENVYFFLLGPDGQQFLPTIKSRCQMMSFQPLVVADLKKIKPGLADWAYQASRGQIDRLMQLTSADGIERRTESFVFLEQFFSDTEFLQNGNWRVNVKDKSWTLATISAWLQILYSVVLAQAEQKSGSSLISIEHSKYFAKIKDISSEKILSLADYLIEAERDILGNADPVLVFENMWVNYARVD
ncbi:MAG: hypothetical protein A2622_13085 [Bdellovibrionales bacterium RIFCSPHIGHO2_01_FULL_40_29]|nr:MAG: hypothetical protein A2622_13085 [Bdellovibrionales bacterium RIFCSPHIGHO2_01_FULL_40_29]OFZ33375.1 MAG: hypothetical protein A3D17_13800 [Bdellovibrionales bacterium RIFCSPHIGHO2_02_FULL_40_15]